MIPRTPNPAFSRHAIRVFLFFLSVLPGCSEIGSPKEEMPAAGPDPGYYTLVADHLKTSFNDHASYNTFSISGFRWVHAVKGWTWLVCVRFQDRGHERTYAMFIKEGAVVDARYAVQADACDTQSYAPFDAMMGGARPAGAGAQPPLY